MRIQIGALALVGLVAVAARADDMAPAGKATTPKECCQSIILAAKAKDYDRMGSYMLEPGKTLIPKMMPALVAKDESEAALKKAADEKFGAGASAEIMSGGMAGRGMPKMNAVIDEHFEIGDVKEDGDSATVKMVRKREGAAPEEKSVPCKKVEGFWFADSPTGGPGGRGRAQQQQGAMDEQQVKIMEIMCAAWKTEAEDVKGLAADIASGTVATKEDAKAKYGGIEGKMMGTLMGAMGGMGGMPPGGRRGGSPKPQGGGGDDQGGGGMGGGN